MNTYEQQAMIFKALCDQKRLEILNILKQGEHCGCVLLEKIDIPQSSLSYHMKILVESTLVSPRKDGKWTHYSLSQVGFDTAKEVLNQLNASSNLKANHCTCMQTTTKGTA